MAENVYSRQIDSDGNVLGTVAHPTITEMSGVVEVKNEAAGVLEVNVASSDVGTVATPLITEVANVVEIKNEPAGILEANLASSDVGFETAPFVTADYVHRVTQNKVSGVKTWQKSGRCAIGAATSDLWVMNTTYAFPATAVAMEVVSSSADDADGGTGVRKVAINYLDADGFEQMTEVTLNGVTPVAMAEGVVVLAVNNFRASEVGSGCASAGNIDIRSVVGATVYSRIATGNMRANNIAYMVPKGKRLTITESSFSVGGSATNKDKSGVITFLADYDLAFEVKRNCFLPYADLFLKDNTLRFVLSTPLSYPELVQIRVQVVSHAADTLVYGMLRGYVEDVV